MTTREESPSPPPPNAGPMVRVSSSPNPHSLMDTLHSLIVEKDRLTQELDKYWEVINTSHQSSTTCCGGGFSFFTAKSSIKTMSKSSPGPPSASPPTLQECQSRFRSIRQALSIVDDKIINVAKLVATAHGAVPAGSAPSESWLQVAGHHLTVQTDSVLSSLSAHASHVSSVASRSLSEIAKLQSENLARVGEVGLISNRGVNPLVVMSHPDIELRLAMFESQAALDRATTQKLLFHRNVQEQKEQFDNVSLAVETLRIKVDQQGNEIRSLLRPLQLFDKSSDAGLHHHQQVSVYSPMSQDTTRGFASKHHRTGGGGMGAAGGGGGGQSSMNKPHSRASSIHSINSSNKKIN
eukprot:TRINITY_DN6146_c1_g2_i1.p1 TRINITY_DN6146_c1_g2~~TRINITY_DN6146_c1_g2_i1.p1  ORF type:complete len:352 (+),score=81.56 TRINITY_DN6146_c1_g2_i1:77-1132(+)